MRDALLAFAVAVLLGGLLLVGASERPEDQTSAVTVTFAQPATAADSTEPESLTR